MVLISSASSAYLQVCVPSTVRPEKCASADRRIHVAHEVGELSRLCVMGKSIVVVVGNRGNDVPPGHAQNDSREECYCQAYLDSAL